MKIPQFIGSALITSSVVTLSAVLAPLTANAANFSFNFQNIAGADSGGDSIVSQFSVDVADNGTGTTLWKFKNAPAATSSASVIAQIYFEWGGDSNSPYKLSVNQLNSGNVGNVNFASGANPSQLPQNNSIDDLALGATNPAPQKGIGLNEALGVIFNSANATDLQAAINSGDLIVGLHVTGIAAYNGNSDSYISSTTTKPVPVPGLLLGVMAAGALGGTRLLKNKKQVA